MEQLEVGYETGADRLLLWLPMVVTHVIDDDSPLANWRDPETVLSDSDATIVVVVRSHHTKLPFTLKTVCVHCSFVALNLWFALVGGTAYQTG